jgi:RHS repeat-associated protein
MMKPQQQTITYTSFNKIATITEGVNSATFIYGPDYQRKCMETVPGGHTIKKYYTDDYERIVSYSGSARELNYIFAGSQLVAIFVQNGIMDSMYYIHTDHLGSLNVITKQSGAIVSEMSFDAWGNRRDPATWQNLKKAPAGLLTSRGFTGHEHIDLFGLINMNGRVYDPVLASFLSPDNYVQAPGYSQSYNRYAYCLNNPLMYTDPSGEFIPQLIGVGIGLFMNEFFGGSGLPADRSQQNVSSLIGTLTGAAVNTFIPGAGGILKGALLGGISGGLSGGLASGIVSSLSGGSFGSAFWSGFKSGAISGTIMGGINGYYAAREYDLNVWTGKPIQRYDLSDLTLVSYQPELNELGVSPDWSTLSDKQKMLVILDALKNNPEYIDLRKAFTNFPTLEDVDLIGDLSINGKKTSVHMIFPTIYKDMRILNAPNQLQTKGPFQNVRINGYIKSGLWDCIEYYRYIPGKYSNLIPMMMVQVKSGGLDNLWKYLNY